MRNGIRTRNMKKVFFRRLVQNISWRGFYGTHTALQKEI